MWEWFTTNSVWILVASAVVLILLLFIRQWVHRIILKSASKERHERLHRRINLALWIIGGIVLVIRALALAAIMPSQEGTPIVTIESVQGWLLEHGILILLIILLSYLTYKAVRVIVPRLTTRLVTVRGKGRSARQEIAKRSSVLSKFLTTVMGAAIVIAAVSMILSEIGLDITPLLAGAGVIGIAIGFGAQSLIKDFLTGLFIVLEDYYSKGDVVRIAGVAGLVEDVNMRRTILRDLDGIVHIIPNGEIRIASNFTRNWSRVNLNIPVAYGEDLDKVIAVINRVGKELAEDETFGPMIIGAPKVLRVDKFADSAIEIKVLGETQPIKQWDVMGELRKRIKKVFDEEGIEIPWPHVKLYFGESPENKGLTCKACGQVNLPASKFCSQCGANLSSGEVPGQTR
jgi:small conductance mechanosensitive channel